jgi:uncharacterized membrane protein
MVKGYERIIRMPNNGELSHRQVNALPVRDPEGNIIGSVSVVRGITEIKRAEKVLLENEAQLKVTEAIEAERRQFFAMLETLPMMICLLTSDYHTPLQTEASEKNLVNQVKDIVMSIYLETQNRMSSVKHIMYLKQDSHTIGNSTSRMGVQLLMSTTFLLSTSMVHL